MKDNVILNKSFDFSVEIIKLYKMLCKNKQEFVLSKQLLRSATSIGANVREAVQAQSKRDFLSKMNIALKEANETMYWIELLYSSEYINSIYKNIYSDRCNELIKLLSSIVKTTKFKLDIK